jgi:hypothetical protein
MFKRTQNLLCGTVVDETPRGIRFASVGEDKQETKQHPIMWYLYMLFPSSISLLLSILAHLNAWCMHV